MDIKDFYRVDPRFLKYVWIILTVLLVDHVIKLLVYYNLNLHEEIRIVGDWFRIRLELNDGTAFAVPFKNQMDRYLKILIKFLLSLALLIILVYYFNKRENRIMLTGLSLCFSGNTGNLIDRVFYGVFINNALESYPVKWFHGRVIDMFYFPLFEIKLPDLLPIIGGENYLFFEPVFNLSDLILVVGAIMTIVGLVQLNRQTNTIQH